MNRKTVLAVATVLVAVAAVLIAAYAVYGHRGSSATTLPQYCVKPNGGFLIVASSRGYNDSVSRLNFTSTGGASAPWPLVGVSQGSNVTIAVCNTDNQAHGFEVQHYFDSEVHTVAPGQAITVSFEASQAGTFRIYCSIFCTIHWAMQDGELKVS